MANAQTPTLQPTGKTAPNTVTLPAGAVLHRIHLDKYGPCQFNNTSLGNARFSPIKNTDGAIIPTIYAGQTLDCALMETIFHDVPAAEEFKTIASSRLEKQLHSELLINTDLTLLDLSTVSLTKLGLKRTQIIDTEADLYPRTRQLAESFHANYTDIQGLVWTSRKHDSYRAYLFFQDRIKATDLQSNGQSKSLTEDRIGAVLDLAEALGVLLVQNT